MPLNFDKFEPLETPPPSVNFDNFVPVEERTHGATGDWSVSAGEQALGRFAKGVTAGIAGPLESIGIASTALARRFGDPILQQEDRDYKVEDRPTYQLGKRLRRKSAEMFPVDESRPQTFLGDVLPEAAGHMIAFLGGGIAGKAAKAGGAATVASLGAGAGGAEAFDEAKKKGASDEDAFKVFAINAGIGTSEAVPIGGWLARLNKASGNKLTRAIREGSEEAIQEIFQQYGGNLTAQKYFDPERSWDQGLAIGGAAGFTLGSLMSLVVSGIGGRRARLQPQEQPQELPPPAAPLIDFDAELARLQRLQQEDDAAKQRIAEREIRVAERLKVIAEEDRLEKEKYAALQRKIEQDDQQKRSEAEARRISDEASSRDRLQQSGQVTQAQAQPEVLAAPVVEPPPAKVEVTPPEPPVPVQLPVHVPPPAPPKQAPISAPPAQVIGKVKGMSSDEIAGLVMQSISDGGMVHGIKEGSKFGHYVIIPKDPSLANDPDETASAIGPFVSKEAADNFLDSEVGAPNAKVVEVTDSFAKSQRKKLEMPHDIVRAILERGAGKLSLAYARTIHKGFKPVGVARNVFTSKGGRNLDDMLDGFHRDGLFLNITSEEQFLDALNAVSGQRQAFRNEAKRERKLMRREIDDRSDFTDIALKNKRPKKQKSDPIPVEELLTGDAFQIAGEQFVVKELIFDNETQELLEVIAEDGKRFGVQRIDPKNAKGGQEILHMDKGTYVPHEPSTEFLSPQDQAVLTKEAPAPTPAATGPLPKLRRGEKQGDVFATQEEPIALVGEQGKDFERIAREKEAAAQAKAEAERIAREQQRPLFARAIWRDNILDSLATWQNSGTPQQLLAHLARTRGAMDEAAWIGLDEFLKGKATVTKAEVEAFVKANQVEVKDVELGKGLSASEEARRVQLHADLAAVGYDLAAPFYEELAELDARKVSSERATKFGNYQTPGGTDYRELLLTLPAKQGGVVGPKGWGDTAGGTSDTLNFRSSHFDEPNILAHVRFNTRTDADGKKVLFIEEIQSDWAQQGRKRGFRKPDPDTTGWTAKNEGAGRWSVYDAQGEWVNGGILASSPEQAIQNLVRMNLHAELGDNINAVPRGPFVTKTEGYVGLVIRRMIRYAAENGFDRIAWTTGEMQAERYDLSKQVQQIAVQRDNLSYTIWGRRRLTGSVPELLARDVPRTKLDEYVGKDLANKIIANDNGLAVQRYEFSGIDLKVGGEGMKAFYDRILPNEVNKFVKKWGGRVGTMLINVHPLSNLPNAQGWDEETRTVIPLSKGIQVHSLELIPAMKQAAIEGMPLFARNVPTSNVPSFVDSQPLIDAAIQSGGGQEALQAVVPLVRIRYGPAANAVPMYYEGGTVTINKEVLDFIATRWPAQAQAYINRVFQEELIHAVADVALTVEEKIAIGQSMTDLDKQRLNRPEIDQMFNRQDQAYHYGSEFINYILGGPDVEIPIDPKSTLGQRVIAALRKIAAYIARAIQEFRARLQRTNPVLDEALKRVTRTIDEINAGIIKAFPTDSQDPLNARAIKDALKMFEAKEQEAPGSGHRALGLAQAGEIVATLPQAQQTLQELRAKAGIGTSRGLTYQQRFARDVAQRVLRNPYIRQILVTQADHLEASINALNGDLETFERLNADKTTPIEELKTAAGNAFETLQMFEQSKENLFNSIASKRPQLIRELAKTFDAEAEALANRDTNEILFNDFKTLGRLLVKVQKDKAVLSAYKQAMDNKVATRKVITFLNKHMDFAGMTYDDLRSVDDLWERIRLMIVNNSGKFPAWDGSVERVIGASEDVIRSVLRIVALSEPIRTELEAAKTMAAGVQYAAPFDRIKTKLGQELRAGNYAGALALYEKGLVDTGINLKESRDAANFYTKDTRRILVNIKTLDEAKAIAERLSADPELIRQARDVYRFHHIAKITHGTPVKGASTTIEFLRANPAGTPMQLEFGNTQEEFQRSFDKAVTLLGEYQAYIANPDAEGYDPRIAAGMERDIDLLGWFTDPSRNPKVRARLLPGFAAKTFDWISSKLGHFALIPKFATIGAVGHLADVESTARTAWSTVEEQRGIILMRHKADLDTTLKAALKSHGNMNPGEYDLKVLAPLAASRQNFNNAGILKPGDGIGNGETVTAEDMRYLKAWRGYENDLYALVNSTGKYKFQAVKMMFAGILFDKNGMVRTPVTHGPNDMGRDFRPVMQEWVKDWFAGDTAKRIALIDFWKDPLLIGYIRGSREVDWKGSYAYPLETREIAREMGENPVTSLEDYVQRVFDLYTAREGVEPKDMDEIQADVLADFDAIFKKIKPFAEQGGDNPKTDLEIIGGNNSFNTPRSVTIMPPGWYAYGGVTVGDRVAMGRQATIGFQLAYRKALEALRDSLAAVVTSFEQRRKVGGVTESQQYAASKVQRMSGDILYDLGEAERLLQNTDNLLTHFKAIMSRSANPYVKDSVHMAAMRGGAQFVITSVVSGPAAVTKNIGGGYQNLAMMDVILRRKNVLWSLATRGQEVIADRLKELIYLTVHEGNPATRGLRKLLESTQNVAFIGDVAKIFLGYANRLRADYDYAKDAGVNYNIDLWATTKAKWKFSKTLGEPRANDPRLYEGWANQVSLVGNTLAQYVGQGTVGFADVRLNTKAIMDASSIEQNFREIAIQFGDKMEASGLFPDKAINKGALGADVGAAVIRDVFRRGGVGSIDAIMADFYRRWVEDKAKEQAQGLPEGALSSKTRLFTDPQYRQLEMLMAEDINLATGSTRPTFGKQSKAHSKLMVLWGWPSWFIQKLTHLTDGLSNKGWFKNFVSNMPTLIQIALLLVLTAPLIYGAASFIKRFFENKVTGFPTVFDAQNPQQAAQAVLAATADSIPFIGSAFNAVSGAGYRTGFDINSQFLFLNLAGDAVRTYKEVVQTGDLGAPMQRFAGRYFFPVNIVGGRLPNMSGMREFSNARNILVMGARGTGLETKLRRVGGGGGTTANYSPSTPFVNEAVNAIGRGDDAGFQSAYAKLVDQKRSAGSLNPASAALTALRSRSPITSVFGTRLEPDELDRVYANVSPALATRARSTIDRFDRAIAGLPRRATSASRGLGRTRRTRAIGFRPRRVGRLRTPSLRLKKPRLRRLTV